MNGLTPIRTVRLLASLIALLGMILLFMERVLSYLLKTAQVAVQMAAERYSNFTGRMALENFSEDRTLYAMVQEAQKMLPSAEAALVVILVVAIALIVVAALALALPNQFAHVLVSLKLLKWETGEEVPSGGANLPQYMNKVSIVVMAVIGAALVVGFVTKSCSESLAVAKIDSASQELAENALVYINAQKAYFAKKKAVGGPKALQLPDSSSSDHFEYTVTASRFFAVAKDAIGDCPAGSKWTVSSGTKGFFTQELTLYRAAPKDTNCVKILPGFKNLGRNMPKSRS